VGFRFGQEHGLCWLKVQSEGRKIFDPKNDERVKQVLGQGVRGVTMGVLEKGGERSVGISKVWYPATEQGSKG